MKPTVGRKVWYRPQGPADDVMARGAAQPEDGEKGAPLDATVVCVHNERMVNLVVFDANGTQHSRCSVELIKDGDSVPDGIGYCEWMPYQIAQAAKEK